MSGARRYVVRLAAAGLALLAIGPFLPGEEDAPAIAPATSTRPATPPAAPPVPADPPDAEARPTDRPGLLQPASGGDGDSWRDTEGREYRLGLINTPETNECFGPEATQERKALTAAGFSADVYTVDHYGRNVAVVRTADGRDLNVHLARYGFADDRYLAEFRDEHPQLAGQLDVAFAEARAERRGLWGTCRDAEATGLRTDPRTPQPDATAPGSSGGCHPDYTTCVAVQGDGSGIGRANDLDCGSIGTAVSVREAGVDPYRLDGDGDGTGCDS